MVPVIDRASQSCLDRSDDDSCVSSAGTPQTPKPDRKALLRARRNACGVGRRCRVRRNVYLAGSGNGDPSEEGPDQTLQILDAKCSCGLVDGSFPRNCNLRSLVRDLAVRNGFPDRPRIAAGKLQDWISTIGGFGSNRLEAYPYNVLIIHDLYQEVSLDCSSG